jgi:menaquinone-9 beta-reductase
MPVDRESDVVIVGGGFAGGPLAAVLARNGVPVTLLERQERYEDKVRGEFMGTWGVAEVAQMGLSDCLIEGGAWALRWWRQWDELFPEDEAPATELTFVRTTPEVEGPVSLSHPATCEAFSRAAADAGARVEFGVDNVRLSQDGPFPVLRYKQGGREHTRTCRIVIGAGGRYGHMARQAGIRLQSGCYHWVSGVAVEGLDHWPDDTLAMGTSGELMFFVFPKGNGLARLYLTYGVESARRFSGPSKVQDFLKAFDLACLPGSSEIVSARPIARLASFPTNCSSTDWPLADGVVLAGDEAGMHDTILGTGLACSLQDARHVSEILLGSKDWSPQAFRGYAAQRAERTRCLNRAAAIMSRLYVEFDDAARERRRNAYQLMEANPAHGLFLLISLAGPEAFPKGPFGDYLSERLLNAA